MSKKFNLQTLLNLAQMNNESATRKLGQLNKQQHDSETKLEVLLQYRKDYQDRLQASTLEGMDPALLRNFQEFIFKLDAAIAQQRHAVELSKASMQKGRGEFTDTQRKLKSFDTLQQRHYEQQLKAEGKVEQRDLDERTGRFFAYKKQEN